MEHIKRFLRGKGFALALIACMLAAAVAGVWAVRVIRAELEKDWQDLSGQSGARSGGQTLNETEDTEQWEQQTEPAAKSVANVPKETASSAARSSASGASGSASGSGAVSEPQELRTGSSDASASASSAGGQLVSGSVLNAFSGDELVYSKTLGDWRTHNGADYACKEGESVRAPRSGEVVLAGADGNWGEVVAIRDSDGRVWRLCGVAKQKVKQGDTVKAGQVIGSAGTISAECAEASHIHVEVLDGEKYLDPAKLMK